MDETLDDITQQCIETIAKEKSIPADGITADSTLEELMLDSLDRVTLSFDLEEKYDIEIPEAQLRAVHTVGDVVLAIREAQAKKRGAATP